MDKGGTALLTQAKILHYNFKLMSNASAVTSSGYRFVRECGFSAVYFAFGVCFYFFILVFLLEHLFNFLEGKAIL